MQFFDFPRDELPVQTSMLTLILRLRSETYHVPTQFLHDLTLHFPFLSFFLTMFVLFRSMVSSLHSLVRSFRSFSLKLDDVRLFGLWLKERVIHTSDTLDS